MNLRLLSALTNLSIANDFLRSVSALLPEGRASRAVGAVPYLISGLDTTVNMLVRRDRKRWPVSRALLIRQAITRHGVRIAVLNESFHNSIEVWQFEQHLVVWDGPWEACLLQSASTIEELAATVLALSAAEIGGALRLTSKGFERDIAVPDSPSEQVVWLTEVTRRELEFAIAHTNTKNRGLLLHGPAGAGKSIAARQIAHALADTVLAVDAATLVSDDHGDVAEMIQAWRPDALVLDDVDHAMRMSPDSSDGRLLSIVDRLRVHVPLIVSTCNVSGSLTGSLIRPGRLADRCESIDLDASTIESMTPNIPLAIRAEAVTAKLRGSYLAELDLRCGCGSDPGEALRELLERQSCAGDGLHAPPRSTIRSTSRELGTKAFGP
jgi:hypothetical protein